jgi:branched-chain amino acid transport system substrate-binding protein
LYLFPLPAGAENEVRIAVIFPMSGLGMKAHQDVLNCARLTVADINQNGGVLGKPLVLQEFDDKSTPVGAGEAAMKAVNAEVAAVVGSSWSSLSLAIAPILQKAQIPMITFSSTHPAVTRVGDYIFRACFTDTFQGKVLSHFARMDLNARTAAVLINASSDYSMGLAAVFSKSFTRNGGRILHKQSYRKEALDFTKLLSPLAAGSNPKARTPDVIFLPGHSRDSALILQQASTLGIETPFLGGDAWQAISRYPDAAAAAESACFTSHWHADVSTPESRRVKTLYYKKYGEKLSAYGPVLMYDAIRLLVDAITRAGTTTKRRLRDAIAATRGYRGASGTITFDETGDPINKEAVILTFANGGIQFLKSQRP